MEEAQVTEEAGTTSASSERVPEQPEQPSPAAASSDNIADSSSVPQQQAHVPVPPAVLRPRNVANRHHKTSSKRRGPAEEASPFPKEFLEAVATLPESQKQRLARHVISTDFFCSRTLANVMDDLVFQQAVENSLKRLDHTQQSAQDSSTAQAPLLGFMVTEMDRRIAAAAVIQRAYRKHLAKRRRNPNQRKSVSAAGRSRITRVSSRYMDFEKSGTPNSPGMAFRGHAATFPDEDDDHRTDAGPSIPDSSVLHEAASINQNGADDWQDDGEEDHCAEDAGDDQCDNHADLGRPLSADPAPPADKPDSPSKRFRAPRHVSLASAKLDKAHAQLEMLTSLERARESMSGDVASPSSPSRLQDLMAKLREVAPDPPPTLAPPPITAAPRFADLEPMDKVRQAIVPMLRMPGAKSAPGHKRKDEPAHRSEMFQSLMFNGGLNLAGLITAAADEAGAAGVADAIRQQVEEMQTQLPAQSLEEHLPQLVRIQELMEQAAAVKASADEKRQAIHENYLREVQRIVAASQYPDIVVDAPAKPRDREAWRRALREEAEVAMRLSQGGDWETPGSPGSPARGPSSPQRGILDPNHEDKGLKSPGKHKAGSPKKVAGKSPHHRHGAAAAFMPVFEKGGHQFLRRKQAQTLPAVQHSEHADGTPQDKHHPIAGTEASTGSPPRPGGALLAARTDSPQHSTRPTPSKPKLGRETIFSTARVSAYREVGLEELGVQEWKALPAPPRAAPSIAPRHQQPITPRSIHSSYSAATPPNIGPAQDTEAAAGMGSFVCSSPPSSSRSSDQQSGAHSPGSPGSSESQSDQSEHIPVSRVPSVGVQQLALLIRQLICRQPPTIPAPWAHIHVAPSVQYLEQYDVTEQLRLRGLQSGTPTDPAVLQSIGVQGTVYGRERGASLNPAHRALLMQQEGDSGMPRPRGSCPGALGIAGWDTHGTADVPPAHHRGSMSGVHESSATQPGRGPRNSGSAVPTLPDIVKVSRSPGGDQSPVRPSGKSGGVASEPSRAWRSQIRVAPSLMLGATASHSSSGEAGGVADGRQHASGTGHSAEHHDLPHDARHKYYCVADFGGTRSSGHRLIATPPPRSSFSGGGMPAGSDHAAGARDLLASQDRYVHTGQGGRSPMALVASILRPTTSQGGHSPVQLDALMRPASSPLRQSVEAGALSPCSPSTHHRMMPSMSQPFAGGLPCGTNQVPYARHAL